MNTDVAQALDAARIRIPIAEARLLLRHVLGVSHAALAAHSERLLSAEEAAAFEEFTSRRARGEPIAYLLGESEFYGLALHITTDVLIPRPETELLVDVALEKAAGRALRILDLGTGSGCVAVALATQLAGAEVTALDASAAALALARRNGERHGVALRCVHSEWFAALEGERYDLIVSNPPYVAAADPHLAQGDLRFEPPGALVSGADGLDAIRHIVAQAPLYLEPEGWLLFEHGYDQAAAVEALLAHAGYRSIAHHADLAGIPRVAVAQRSQPQLGYVAKSRD